MDTVDPAWTGVGTFSRRRMGDCRRQFGPQVHRLPICDEALYVGGGCPFATMQTLPCSRAMGRLARQGISIHASFSAKLSAWGRSKPVGLHDSAYVQALKSITYRLVQKSPHRYGSTWAHWTVAHCFPTRYRFPPPPSGDQACRWSLGGMPMWRLDIVDSSPASP